MSFNRYLFSSATGEWGTPQTLYAVLNAEFSFTLDACATGENAKAPHYYSEGSLDKPWEGVVWCNPPYGREIGAWIQKGYEAARNGATVVMLLLSRTDTRWFADYVMKSSEIRFIKGRLRFNGARNSAPFPSMIVVFDSSGNEHPRIRLQVPAMGQKGGPLPVATEGSTYGV